MDFHGRNWRIPSFYENKTQPTKVGFIFIGLNSLSLAEDLAAVNHVTQAVVRVESKIGIYKSGLRNYGSSQSF